jgi:hypothetical protein
MQCVCCQRLARGFFGDALERAGAKEIDHDRDRNDREGVRRRLDRMSLPAEQPLHGFESHAGGEQKQQSGFGKRRHAFDLAVAVLMLGVGRLAGDAHCRIGQHRRSKVQERVTGFGQDRQRAGENADHCLGDGQRRGGGNRSQRGFFLIVHKKL